ncbi:hypothetical protein ACB092_02G197200 [Castanea dentata]
MKEYILSGGGVKELLYATNNKAPRHTKILNLIHLVPHDYNPHNIPKPRDVLLSDPSHLCFSLPLIKTQQRSSPCTHTTSDLPSPNDDAPTTGCAFLSPTSVY